MRATRERMVTKLVQHAAEPTRVNIGHTATVGLSSDGFLSLLLGADEENGAALLGDVLNEGVGLVKTDEGLLENR